MSLFLDILSAVAEVEQRNERPTEVCVNRKTWDALCDEAVPATRASMEELLGVEALVDIDAERERRAEVERLRAQWGLPGSAITGIAITFDEELKDGFCVVGEMEVAE